MAELWPTVSRNLYPAFSFGFQKVLGGHLPGDYPFKNADVTIQRKDWLPPSELPAGCDLLWPGPQSLPGQGYPRG